MLLNYKKRAFSSSFTRKIFIRFQITFIDNGPGFTDGEIKDREGGLGNYLLKNMARQLKGEVMTKNDNGAVSMVFFHKKGISEND